MRSSVLSGWFWAAVIAVTVTALLCAAVVVPALAQEVTEEPIEEPPVEPPVEEPPAEPALGEQVDVFLVLALPATILIATIIGQVLKFLFPEQQIATETLAGWVRGIFAIGYILALLMGFSEQLTAGVTFLNDVSEPVLMLLGLLLGVPAVIVGPSALYEYAKKRDWPFLGQKQGQRALAFNHDPGADRRRAA